MKVLACIKQTPATEAVYSVDGGNVSWDVPGGGKPNVINPWDEYAVEEAVRLKENHGASDVGVLTIGADSVEESIRTAIAMGCTSATRVDSAGVDGSGAAGTARVLAAAIKAEGADIVLMGKQAIDGDTGTTPVMTARALGWTPLTYVSAIKEVGGGSITVERKIEAGTQTVTASLPVVISVVSEINEPRYPSFMGIRKAKKAAINVVDAGSLGVEGAYGAASANVDWSNITAPETKALETEMLTGSPAEVAAQLADKLIGDQII